MSEHYDDVAFTRAVRAAQARYRRRDRATVSPQGARGDHGAATTVGDAMTDTERAFIAERDGFYLASVGETGWPYVQYRGGPPGFLKAIDAHTLGWADFRGNLQYVSTGNLAGDDRVAMIIMDYARQRRLKIFGRASIVAAADDPETVQKLEDPAYPAVVERAVLISVTAFDWNCPQHITPRYTLAELEPHLAALRNEIEGLQAENAQLRRLGDGTIA